MKRKRFWILTFTALCCLGLAGAWGLRTVAASGSASAGNIVTGDGRVVLSDEDITYLNNELELLQKEIDYSVLSGSSADVTVFDSADHRRSLITSHGIINYDNGKAVADAAGLFALADATDALGSAYATVICRLLNSMGTYFDEGGNINHASQTTQTIVLDGKRLADGIRQSQSVEHMTCVSVTAENITAGAAAWVDGIYIIGNGADNERAYQRGIEDGAAGNDADVDIQPIHHVHRKGNGEEATEETVYAVSDPGGCFVADGHMHNAVDTCATESVRCTGFTGAFEHHPLCVDSGSGYGTDIGHVNCGALCQKCGYWMPTGYTACNNIVTSYICGEPDNTWTIGCGMEKGQLESVTVVIRKHSEREE